MNNGKQKGDNLGKPGEIRQYDRTDGPDSVRGDDLNPNKEPEGTPLYVTGNSTLQSPEEDAHDRSVDPNKDSGIRVSNDDINQPIPPRMAGDSNQQSSGQEEE
jgi:hypothetical protein